MKQYRITSQDFVLPGESGEDDAVMHPDDLAEIKRLAGIAIVENEGASSPSVGGYVNDTHNIPGANEEGIVSPVGSNISYTANQRNELLKKYNPEVGSDLWFIINFSKPYLNGSVEQQIERYFKQHPDQRRRYQPQ